MSDQLALDLDVGNLATVPAVHPRWLGLFEDYADMASVRPGLYDRLVVTVDLPDLPTCCRCQSWNCRCAWLFQVADDREARGEAQWQKNRAGAA